MSSKQPGARLARMLRFAITVPLFALGGCTVSIEDGFINLAEAIEDGPCGIFYACDDYRDRDQGRRENDDNQGQPPTNGGNMASTGSSGSSGGSGGSGSPSNPVRTN